MALQQIRNIKSNFIYNRSTSDLLIYHITKTFKCQHKNFIYQYFIYNNIKSSIYNLLYLTTLFLILKVEIFIFLLTRR